MELDEQSNAQSEVIQPEDVVVTDSETTEAKPQAEATEEQELFVDDSSDDQSTSHKSEMTQAQAYAAFQKKKKQSAARKEELNASAVREQKLQDELNELKATVGKITKGSPPTLDECDWNEEEYHKRYQAYHSAPEAKQKAVAQPAAANNPVNDEAEFYLYEREQALAKLVPNYEQAKTNVVESFAKYGIADSNQAMNYLSNIARQKKVDIAKVVVAMNEMPHILDSIVKAGNNDFAIADILETAAGKVKTRSKKRIDSKPEPELNNTGPIDNSSAATTKAFKTWQASPTLANHKRYLAAKNSK